MPTSPISYPLVNGARHSFVSIELNLNGSIFIGFKSINYTRTRSRSMAMGNHPDPIGKTRGTNEYKADCELYLAEWNQFVLDTLGGQGYGDRFFNILVTYNETGLDPIQDQLIGCTFDTSDAQNSQGNDPTVRKFDLNPVKIVYSGVDDVADPLTGVESGGIGLSFGLGF